MGAMSTFHAPDPANAGNTATNRPPSTTPNPPSPALTAANCTANTSPSAASTQKRHLRCKLCGNITQGILAFSALLLGVVMALWTYASLEEAREANRKAEWANKLAEWSSLQAFREDCRAQNETARVLSQDCSVALNHPLPSPPGIETVHNRRAVIVVSLHSSELASATLDLRRLQHRLVFVGVFIAVCAVITYRAVALHTQADDEGIYIDHPSTAFGYPWTSNATARTRAVLEPALASQEDSGAFDDNIVASATSMDVAIAAGRSHIRRRVRDPNALRSSQVAEDAVVELDAKFRLYTERERKVAFRRGSVIAVFWHENYGPKFPPDMSNNDRLGPGWVSRVNNEAVYSRKRIFAIVKEGSGFSVGIPISSYGGKGLALNRMSQDQRQAHTIVYALGNTPTRREGEAPFTKEPICIDTSICGETLSSSSRLCYSKPQSIEHNIKIKHLGHVLPKDLPTLLLDYRQANMPTSLSEFCEENTLGAGEI